VSKYLTQSVCCLHCSDPMCDPQTGKPYPGIPMRRVQAETNRRFETMLHARLETAERLYPGAILYADNVKSQLEQQLRANQLDRLLYPEHYPAYAALCGKDECVRMRSTYYVQHVKLLAESEQVQHECWSKCQTCTSNHFQTDQCNCVDCPIFFKRTTIGSVVQTRQYILDRLSW
jgi:hypothetical protein